MKRTMLFASVVIALLPPWSNAGDETGYAIVYNGAVAMRKPPPLKGLVTFPWLDPSETFFSSCGFAELEYNQVPVKQPLDSYADIQFQRATFYYMTGEWCDVGPALFEEPHYSQNLIWFRSWKGKRYIVLHARVYQDGAGVDYISDNALVEWAELQSLIRDITQGEENTGCFSQEDSEFQTHSNSGQLVQVGEKYCFKRGVFIRDLAESANKPLQRTRSKQRASER